MKGKPDNQTRSDVNRQNRDSSESGESRIDRRADETPEQHPGLINPVHDQEQNAAGQPIGDPAPMDVPARKRDDNRTPAKGSGVPPSSGLGDEDIESEIEPFDEETGRIRSGRTDSTAKPTPNPGKTEDF